MTSELNLPPLVEEVIPVEFSRIEDAFYKREFQRILKLVEPVLRAWRSQENKAKADRRRLSSSSSSSSSAAAITIDENMPSETSAGRNLLDSLPLSKEEQEKTIMLPLLALRQACVHPMIGSRGIRTSASRMKTSKATADKQGRREKFGQVGHDLPSMADVLASMIQKAVGECEDAMREIVASENGLAGLYILNDEAKEALTLYRKVIDSGNAVGQGTTRVLSNQTVAVRVDILQRIHALRNFLLASTP